MRYNGRVDIKNAKNGAKTHKLGLKQGSGAYLREKLSSRGFSAKTEGLNVIKLKLWGLTHKNNRPGRRVLIWESSGVKTINSGLNWEYFYTIVDCGLNSKKCRGFLAKRIGRTGIYARGPLDLDLVDQICWALDLIVAADSGSGGQEGLDARAAAELAGTHCSAAAR